MGTIQWTRSRPLVQSAEGFPAFPSREVGFVDLPMRLDNLYYRPFSFPFLPAG